MLRYPGNYAWYSLTLLTVVVTVWIAITSLELPLHQLAGPAASASVLAIAIGTTQTIRPDAHTAGLLDRLAAFFQGMLFLQLGWIVLRLFNHVSMATGLPLADDGLAAIDAAIGFDWQAYFAFVHDRPMLLDLLAGSYTSLTVLSSIGFFALLLAADLRRVRFFLETFLYTAVACMLIGMMFPAEAAVAYYAVDVARFPNFATPPGLYHKDHLIGLRAGTAPVLDLRALPGLVTFPSFHTAAGIVLAAAFFRTLGFLPAAAYTAVMIASTPVFGGHYLVDLLGGAAVAATVIIVMARRPEFAGLFAARTHQPAVAA